MPQRLLMYGSSAALAAGGVLMPNGALTATAAVMPHRAAAATTAAGINIPAVDWSEVTDAPSGITARLPGEAEVVEFGESACRDYSAETADTHVSVLFTVCDVQGTPKRSDLQAAADGATSSFRKEFGNVAVDSSTRETEFDGHPTLDLRLSVKDGGPEGKISAHRYIADDSHFVIAQTVADARNEESLNSTHKRLIAGIRIPD
ncbi:hypothetical protein [Streptomyces sp. G1]|uniref:hypothetical protein n=1 Tax=Streptomyces sp. G1 TaxID=361572 RepID=UPI00202F3E93|nr:hypothetical protein [Streptomyces sp. G1]MCM1973716.1 hypothetical protein [Streptomyces sp. G1]